MKVSGLRHFNVPIDQVFEVTGFHNFSDYEFKNLRI
jgi:hypothetical protein